MLRLKLQYFSHLMWRADSFKKTLMLERLGAGGEGDDRGWDGWMASPIQWTWVWANSGGYWKTGKPGVLESMGSQRDTWLSEWTTASLRAEETQGSLAASGYREWGVIRWGLTSSSHQFTRSGASPLPGPRLPYFEQKNFWISSWKATLHCFFLFLVLRGGFPSGLKKYTSILLLQLKHLSSCWINLLWQSLYPRLIANSPLLLQGGLWIPLCPSKVLPGHHQFPGLLP